MELRQQETYRFSIDVFTPSTIPMARLAEYMAELATLLGNTRSVHFVRLDEGSTELVHSVEFEAIPKVRQRLRMVNTPEAPIDIVASYRKLNGMLRNDNAVGRLVPDREKNSVLIFPGRDTVLPQVIGPFNQRGQIDGVLVRIGGKDKTAHAQIQDIDGVTRNCDMTRNLAREMAQHIFGCPIRVFGIARWQRNEDGNWEMLSFRAEHFNELDEYNLAGTVDTLRKSISDKWTDDIDPLKLVRDLREDGNGVH